MKPHFSVVDSRWYLSCSAQRFSLRLETRAAYWCRVVCGILWATSIFQPVTITTEAFSFGTLTHEVEEGGSGGSLAWNETWPGLALCCPLSNACALPLVFTFCLPGQMCFVYLSRQHEASKHELNACRGAIKAALYKVCTALWGFFFPL